MFLSNFCIFSAFPLGFSTISLMVEQVNPRHGPLLYEGKAKKVFNTDNPEEVLVYFKNDATAFNALKRAELEGKGRLNCQISALLFEFLQQEGIHTHYLGLEGDTWMRVQRLKIFPLEVVIRNIAAGSLCKQTPIKEGQALQEPLLDFYYKDDDLGDPILTESRIRLLDLLKPLEKSQIENLAFVVNSKLKDFFDDLGLALVDFKIELGINHAGKIAIADEISPDTCRLWDKKYIEDPKNRILDKDRFRQDLGGVLDGYREIFKRIQSSRSFRSP